MNTIIPNQNNPVDTHPLSLGHADIPELMVTDAVDAIISQIAPEYINMMREAHEKPEIMTDYKSSLYNDYKYLSLSSEMIEDLREQRMAPDCIVIKKKLPSRKEITVFSEKNRELEVNQVLGKARVYIRLRIEPKDIKSDDPLDHLLSQLYKKIFPHALGEGGRFDIRLEKGVLPFQGGAWRWHLDGGELFKTSITVCFSNKKNWSTRIMNSENRSSDHGFLYDALKVYHRAPVPSDLQGEELAVDDYRLFIRYNDFYPSNHVYSSLGKTPIPLRELPSIPSIDFTDRKHSIINIREEFLKTHLARMMTTQNEIFTLLDIKSSFSLIQDPIKKSITPLNLDLTHLILDNVNRTQHLAGLTLDESDFKQLIPSSNVVPVQEKNKLSQCIVM